MESLVRAQQLDRETIAKIFEITDQISESNTAYLFQNKILASLFYEPSTRTRFSFESAMLRLGGQTISTENASKFSSATKGEHLEDTIRVMHNYADVIILRHPEKGSAERAAAVSKVPVINAGDGADQHPTQALLDLYTIKKELGKIDGIHITMVGDLKNGRTVRSLAYLLGKYDNIVITFVSPDELKIGDDIKTYLTEESVEWEERGEWDKVINKTDVIYQTRVQKERFPSIEEYHKLNGTYTLNRKEVDQMKDTSIIMHPLPRLDELAPDVDDSPKAAYFRQAKYGLIVRMALLQFLLK